MYVEMLGQAGFTACPAGAAAGSSQAKLQGTSSAMAAKRPLLLLAGGLLALLQAPCLVPAVARFRVPPEARTHGPTHGPDVKRLYLGLGLQLFGFL